MGVCASTTSLLEQFPHEEIFHNRIHVVFIFSIYLFRIITLEL